jgi:hypothetical protein
MKQVRQKVSQYPGGAIEDTAQKGAPGKIGLGQPIYLPRQQGPIFDASNTAIELGQWFRRDYQIS